jgi:hypothetical protein
MARVNAAQHVNSMGTAWHVWISLNFQTHFPFPQKMQDRDLNQNQSIMDTLAYSCMAKALGCWSVIIP